MNLLLGGSGFIGSRLAEQLVVANQDVTVLDRQAGEVTGVDYRVADLAQERLDQELVNRAERVYVLFGQIYPGFPMDQELDLIERVAQQLKRGRGHIYFFSTALVYGPCTQPANESSPTKPLGDYAQYKLAAEQTLQKLLPKKRLTTYRLANIYGDPKNKGVINKVIQVGLQGSQEELTIDRNRRDYLLVDDLVQVIIALQNQSSQALVNIATGQSVEVSELINIVSQITGKQIEYKLRETKAQQDYDCLLDNSLLGCLYPLKHLHPLAAGLKLAVDRLKV